MVLIDVRTPKTFEEYVANLSKKGKRAWRFVKNNKENQNLIYQRVPYNREEVKQFMELWERQLIRGKYMQWAFTIDYPEKLERLRKLMCFACFKGQEKIALHFVENHLGYVECHPVMYDKTKYLGIGLAKFMWFHLVKYAIEDKKIDWLDLGGGIEDNWQEAIKRRHEFPTCFYKWTYVSREVKRHPEKQPKLRLYLPQGKLGDIKVLQKIE
jgi:hypothetical protein